MISFARAFRTFSQCGSDSWISSNKIPPRPFKSYCLSSFTRVLPSFSLKTGLKENRVLSIDTSIFGLFCRASVCNHFFFRIYEKDTNEIVWKQSFVIFRFIGIGLHFLLMTQYPIDWFRLKYHLLWVDDRLLPNAAFACVSQFWPIHQICTECFQPLFYN